MCLVSCSNTWENFCRSRLEYLSNVTGQITDQKDSEFDSMVILDRSVDYITPFRSQLTYEGLLDELYSINSCFVELDASFFPPSSISGNAKSKKIMVNGSDVVFSAIRDQSFESRVVPVGHVANVFPSASGS